MTQTKNKPKTPEQLLDTLESWGIPYKLYKHDPVFTVSEGKDLKARLEGAHTKNLYLRNKKKQNFLVTMLDDQSLDLKAFAKKEGLGNLSFGSDSRLMEFLGVAPGSVTPFAAINAKPNSVTIYLDAQMMEHAILNYHPLKNDMTIGISKEHLLEFFENLGHTPKIVTLPKV